MRLPARSGFTQDADKSIRENLRRAFPCVECITATGKQKMPKRPDPPWSIDWREREHSARCRAATLREIARSMQQLPARAQLEKQADEWDRLAKEAAGHVQASQLAATARHKRLND